MQVRRGFHQRSARETPADGLVSNLSQDVRLYRKIKSGCMGIAESHREFVQQDEFLAKIKSLQDQFHIHVNIVATPENLPLIEEISGAMSRGGVTLHVDPYVDVNFKYSPEQRALLERCIDPDRNPETQLGRPTIADFQREVLLRLAAITSTSSLMATSSVCAGGLGYLRSGLHRDFPNPAGMDLSQFALGNLRPGVRAEQKQTCGVPCPARKLAIAMPWWCGRFPPRAPRRKPTL